MTFFSVRCQGCGFLCGRTEEREKAYHVIQTENISLCFKCGDNMRVYRETLD